MYINDLSIELEKYKSAIKIKTTCKLIQNNLDKTKIKEVLFKQKTQKMFHVKHFYKKFLHKNNCI